MAKDLKTKSEEHTLDEAQREKIGKVINERLASHQVKSSCPMCNYNAFSLTDRYVTISTQSDINVVVLGAPSIPAIAMICKNCGFISQHALGVLGLLSEEGVPK